MSGRTTRSGARLAGIATVLALAAGSTAAAAGPGNGYRTRAARLRVQAQLLDTRAHKALLDLYVLDSRIGTAQRALARLESRSARLSVQRATLTQELTAARLTLAVSRRQLGDRLRGLYEQGPIDPLAVVFGARSLDDALTRLDDLSAIANQSRTIVEVTSAARARLTQVAAALALQQRKLDAALAAARRTEQQLAAARADEAGYVESLRARGRLKEARIRSLLATARAVEAKAHQIAARAAVSAAAATPPRSEPPAAPDGTPVTAGAVSAGAVSAGAVSAGAVSAGAVSAGAVSAGAVSAGPVSAPGGRTLTVSSTGYSLPGHTATGLPVGWGVVAVDPSVIPLGTKLTIPGYGEGVAADVGSAVHGAMIDLWFPTLAQARAWGRRTITITLH